MVSLPPSFLVWTDSDDLKPAVKAMGAELEAGPRWKTPEKRLVCRLTRFLLGCLMTTPSVDLLVDELPVDDADLIIGRKSRVKTSETSLTMGQRPGPYRKQTQTTVFVQQHRDGAAVFIWLPAPVPLSAVTT